MIFVIARITRNITVLDLLKPEKITLIKNVHISGQEDKNRSWKIKAEECWTGRQKHKSIFENVSSCTIYEDDWNRRGHEGKLLVSYDAEGDILRFETFDKTGEVFLSAGFFEKQNFRKDTGAGHVHVVLGFETSGAGVEYGEACIYNFRVSRGTMISEHIRGKPWFIFGNRSFSKCTQE